jgi:hypothetical protein
LSDDEHHTTTTYVFTALLRKQNKYVVCEEVVSLNIRLIDTTTYRQGQCDTLHVSFTIMIHFCLKKSLWLAPFGFLFYFVLNFPVYENHLETYIPLSFNSLNYSSFFLLFFDLKYRCVIYTTWSYCSKSRICTTYILRVVHQMLAIYLRFKQ